MVNGCELLLVFLPLTCLLSTQLGFTVSCSVLELLAEDISALSQIL